GTLLLRAKVQRLSEGSNRYSVDAGFRLNGRFPLLTIAEGEKSKTIVVSVAHLRFASDQAFGIVAVDPLPAVTSRLIAGHLVPGKFNPSGGREWSIGSDIA